MTRQDQTVLLVLVLVSFLEFVLVWSVLFVSRT